jgi:glycosyltransferase involved in cell wall biosynthesis
LDASVIVTGFVEDMRPYIAKSSIVICPHISGTGIKNKVLEAMSMGKPVITTPVGSLGINADNCENIIIAKNDNEFATKIIKMFEDKYLRQKIGDNARELIVSQYSWDKIIENISDLFHK